MVEEYGFGKWLEGKVDIDNFKEALKILANTSIDSGCKADIAKKPVNVELEKSTGLGDKLCKFVIYT